MPVLTRRASRLWRSVPNALRLVEPKGSHRSSLFQNKQKSPHKAGCFVYGGEGGIRTLDTLLTYTPLAGERLQPLGHFSKFCYSRFCLMLLSSSSVKRCWPLYTLLAGSSLVETNWAGRLPYLFMIEVPSRISRCTILNFVSDSLSDVTPYCAHPAPKLPNTRLLWAEPRGA